MTVLTSKIEIWKPVLGYEGWYEVSCAGRVRRIKGGKGAQAGHILTPRLKKDGYLHVSLSKNNKQRNFCIHVLVCLTFVGPRPSSKHEVNHKNLNKQNNWFNNLEWLTHKENLLHRINAGIGTKNYIVKSPTGKKFHINNLAKFCREHDLGIQNMNCIANERKLHRKTHKGWSCILLEGN